MNKIIYSLLILFTINLCANAEAFNSTNYSDIGVFYSNTTFPQSVVKKNENTTLPDDLSKFKKGEAASHNFFNLIDIGNAGIDAAAKNGNIKKIHYVDTKVGKVYIPLFFIPIYVKETKTVVYGE